MSIRRMVAGGLVLAFLAPLVLAARPGGPTAATGGPSASCCVAMPCCETGAACAAGGCESRKAPSPADAPRLAAGCPGPAPAAVPAVDRDPMVAASALAAPSPSPLAGALPTHASIAPDLADDPTDPPPRA